MNKLITTIDPTTGSVLKTYEGWSATQIDAAVDAGHAAAAAWGLQPLSVRMTAVRRLADELRRQKDTFAALITAEMGKPLAAGELESWRAGELESWRAGELESWRAGELEKIATFSSDSKRSALSA